ncbi:hypothetical protein GCM10027176_39520 [Actinoallomurus bryophytorum]|uniref:Uncharacterized protein n=1 Tax=Actinoallomurus bryophytorum TaxID=1490222 RepID=A0A543CWR6_9ACTN|nr:hypothetical protein [Actinoallomurus bryophytorum]TQM01545.1 hypothetical protein FB559_7306 [Actinoallomurus bryophytorum]
MNSYSFLPWLRQGIATQIKQAPGTAPRASVEVKLRLDGKAVSGDGTLTLPAGRNVALYGPGDVIGVDERAVVRTEPRDSITNFDPNFLPFAEFYDEDFPWRYSPDVADPATGRLRPWLALVVLTEEEFTGAGPAPGRPLPFITVTDLNVLPPADQIGAWAHVHVNRTVTASEGETVSDDMTAVLPRLASVLAENPDLACSRVMCPRRLDPERSYHAFLVPAFETGRLAGLGLDPATSPGALQSSWAGYANRPESANLCYYRHWTFSTASIGDFEYLVRLLQPRPVDVRVGNRDMDVRAPGGGLPGIDDPALGGVLRLGGALKVPDEDLDPEERADALLHENWDQPYPHPFQRALAALINLADDYTRETPAAAHGSLAGAAGPPDPDPLVTPPLYGRWHALASRLLSKPDGTPITPDDDWVHELNLDPRFRVAAGIGARVVREHQEEFMNAAWQQLGDVLAGNRRIRAAQVAREVGHSFHANHLAPLRPATPGQLFALTAPLQSRVPSGGVDGLSDAPMTTITAALADSTVATTPLSPAMRRVTRPRSRLVRGLFEDPADRHELLVKINTGQVAAAPAKTAPPAVVTVDDLEGQLGPIFELVPGGEPRPGLLPDPIPDPVGSLATSSDFVISLPAENVHPTGGGTDSGEAVRFKQALHDAYAAFNVAQDAGFTPPRTPADLTGLGQAALAGLHPDRTVPRRALGGIALPERFLPPGGIIFVAGAQGDPDTTHPLTEVMAYPVIDLPMYRPLLDLSPDLFLPNVNLVPHNSITLLDTNRRFVESYLVGLNHEMAREMMWREFPTDQRGSVFRQFWDVRSVRSGPDEDPADRRERLYDIPAIDTWEPGSALGDHDNREPSATDVVLVIRGELLKKYPTAVIYAHRADWQRNPDGSIDRTRPRRLAVLTPAEETDPPRGKVRLPLYDAKVEPDIYFFGFDLTDEAVRGGDGTHPGDDPGWFFVIKERPGDPRFGLDIERDTPLRVWNDLSWPDVLTPATGPRFIRLDAQTPTLTLTRPGEAELADQYDEDRQLTWDRQINAADLAYILYQAPVLVAVHAREMLGDA